MPLAVPLDPARNPGFLKLDLLCRGARLVEPEGVVAHGGRPVVRTRAGLGSGLELVLDGGLWVNVPVVEPFARSSPYEIRVEDGSQGVRITRDGRPCVPARLAPRPSWYEHETPSGKPMRRVGTLQGTYLAIYPGRVCDFWKVGAARAAPERCRFCSVGLNLGADDDADKSVEDVMATVRAARRESRITYVDFNAGHADDSGFLDALTPYVRRVKAETGLLVGIQTPPHPDPTRWRGVRALGVNRVSFCFELFDPERFREVCPGKARVYGQKGYFDAIDACLAVGREPGAALEPWVVNGEIVAGLEPVASSVAAIRWLVERGAIPTVCVFRPLVGTDLADRPPPSTEDLVPVYQELYVRCLEKGLPVGVAPNVHVSLVPLPEECRWLVQDEAWLARARRQERRLGLRKLAFGAAFRTRLAWKAATAARAASRPAPSHAASGA